MKYYTAERIELTDGRKIIAPQIFCFMGGDMQGFIAIQSKEAPQDTRPDDIPVDIISTAHIKQIIGAIVLNRSTGGGIKYFSGYKY